MFAFVNFGLICLNYVFVKRLPIRERKKNKLFLMLVFLQCVLTAGTRRLDVGADTLSYYRIYNLIANYKSINDYKIGYEPLYTLVCLCCSKIGFGFLGVNIVIAGLTMFFFCKAVYQSSASVYGSVYLYFTSCIFYQMFNQSRQLLAITIVFYAISFLINGNKKKFVFGILLAAGFHYSALVCFVLLPLVRIKITKKIVCLYGVTAIIFYIFSSVIMNILANTIYGNYVGGSYDVNAMESAVLNLGIRLIMLLIVAFFYKQIKERKSDIDIYYHMALLCTVMQLLTVKSALFGRITTYFFSGYMILFPEILVYGYHKKTNKVVACVVFVVAFFVYHYVYSMYKYDGGFNYVSCLFE